MKSTCLGDAETHVPIRKGRPQHALSGLGYKQIRDVRQGKFFVLNLDGWSRTKRIAAERISKEVLTNPVIENIDLKSWSEPRTPASTRGPAGFP